ncbi:MAG TPA: transketolase C-terminal domain-containing protein, partial [Solirubrobacteraceae bacterium]
CAGVSASVAVVACIAPAPNEDLAELVGRVGLAVTIEAHYRTGGLGSLVAEVIADNAIDCRLVRVGVDSVPDGRSGTQARLEQRHGLSASALVQTIGRALSFA